MSFLPGPTQRKFLSLSSKTWKKIDQILSWALPSWFRSVFNWSEIKINQIPSCAGFNEFSFLFTWNLNRNESDFILDSPRPISFHFQVRSKKIPWHSFMSQLRRYSFDFQLKLKNQSDSVLGSPKLISFHFQLK